MSKPEAVRLIFETWPGVVRHKNADGFLPVHLAAAQDYLEPDVVNLLVEEWPESVRETNNEG
jgi:hypothetical protein